MGIIILLFAKKKIKKIEEFNLPALHGILEFRPDDTLYLYTQVPLSVGLARMACFLLSGPRPPGFESC